jgi:hypothetical protein
MKTKGQIFILSVLILGGVIALGLIIITVFTSHLRLSREARYSLQAFYLSDSKAERELYNQFTGGILANPPECKCNPEDTEDTDQCLFCQFQLTCSHLAPGVECRLDTQATYEGVTRSSQYYFPGS